MTATANSTLRWPRNRSPDAAVATARCMLACVHSRYTRIVHMTIAFYLCFKITAQIEDLPCDFGDTTSTRRKPLMNATNNTGYNIAQHQHGQHTKDLHYWGIPVTGPPCENRNRKRTHFGRRANIQLVSKHSLPPPHPPPPQHMACTKAKTPTSTPTFHPAPNPPTNLPPSEVVPSGASSCWSSADLSANSPGALHAWPNLVSM